MTNPVDDQIKTLFDNPESGPETDGGNLPEKGQVLSDKSTTEEAVVEAAQAAEDAAPVVETKEPEKVAAEPAPEASAAPPQPDRVASARLRQIERLRRQKQEATKERDDLRKELAEIRKAISGDEDNEALAEEQLNANPALKRIYERVSGLEKNLQERVLASDQDNAAYQQALDVNRYALEAVQSYKSHTPDWEEAYHWQREQLAKEKGLDKWPSAQREQQLNVWEHEASAMLAEIGEDPAALIYEQAVARGWKPGMQPAAPANGNGTVHPTIAPSTTRRIRDSAPSLSQVGVGGQSGGDRLSRDEFYRRFDKSQRIAIFNDPKHGEDIFESLDTKGEVPISLLPR